MSLQASVRLLINYNKSHKAVVRVSPGLPLRSLLPAVCDKCEFKVETTVLLRDSQSGELLDLSKTLNEHGLREVFAKDTAAVDQEARAQTPDSGKLQNSGSPGSSTVALIGQCSAKTLKYSQIKKTLGNLPFWATVLSL